MLQAHKAECALQQKLMRENAELSKSASVREERLYKLTQHRQITKQDKQVFKEIKQVCS